MEDDKLANIICCRDFLFDLISAKINPWLTN